MVRKYNPPVSIMVYLGSGVEAEKLRLNIIKAAGKDSLSEYVVSLLKKAEPSLFKGVKDGKK